MYQPKNELIPLVGLIVIAFLGCTMEIDISIPSFPSIRDYFQATEAQVQSTLTANFIAFCISGLLYGPLSDAWGRRKLMIFGAGCFMIGAIGCVLAQTIHQLIIWRFIQGVGASSALVLGFAMLLDRYQGKEAADKVGLINAFCTIFMATAPILGGVLIYFYTWRANYSLIALIAILAWVALLIYLPETKKDKQPFIAKQIIRDYYTIITHKKFMAYAALPNLLCVAYLTFVGSASFYYINTNHLNPLVFALHQGALVICFSLTSFYSGNIIDRIGEENAVSFGMKASIIAMVLLIGCAFGFPKHPMLITLSMCLFAVGCAFPMSVTFSQSLEVIPELKGSCSSFMMSSRFLYTGITMGLTSIFFDGTMRPVAIIMLGAVLIACGLFSYIRLQPISSASDYKPAQSKG